MNVHTRVVFFFRANEHRLAAKKPCSSRLAAVACVSGGDNLKASHYRTGGATRSMNMQRLLGKRCCPEEAPLQGQARPGYTPDPGNPWAGLQSYGRAGRVAVPRACARRQLQKSGGAPPRCDGGRDSQLPSHDTVSTRRVSTRLYKNGTKAAPQPAQLWAAYGRTRPVGGGSRGAGGRILNNREKACAPALLSHRCHTPHLTTQTETHTDDAGGGSHPIHAAGRLQNTQQHKNPSHSKHHAALGQKQPRSTPPRLAGGRAGPWLPLPSRHPLRGTLPAPISRSLSPQAASGAV
jgi:hypothetical protein